jgi:hypothetical protein
VIVAPAQSAPPLAVTTSASPAWSYFAGTVVVRVDVVVDVAQVDPGSVRLTSSFDPWQVLEPVRSPAASNGALEHRSWVFTIACLKAACLPKGTGAQSFRLPRLTVAARTRAGSDVRVTEEWPTLRVAGRFAPPPSGAGEVAFPPLVTPADVSRTTYAVDPTALAFGLDVLGIALLAAFAVIALVTLFHWLGSGRSDAGSVGPVARAASLVRQSQSRPEGDRRRAVGLLARALRPEANALAASAAEVAWGPPEPEPARLEELATAAEDEVERR